MIIQLLNGTTIDIEELFNVKRLFHRIPSLVAEHLTQRIDGRGNVIVGTEYNQRTISVTLLYDVNDIYSYYLLRDELNALFTRTEAFYIIFKSERYKRYKVRLAQQLSIEPNARMNSFDIEFIADDKYAESTGTSLDLQNRKEWDADLWSFGSGIQYDNAYNYTFNSNNFVVKNVGNATINPRESNLLIRIRGTFGSFVQITNKTTNDVYRLNNALGPSDELVLDGVRTLRNSLSRFRDTNGALLTLSPGDNNFIIEGGTVQSVIFDFRFLYK